MPSHLTHQVFVEEALQRAGVTEPLQDKIAPYTVLGAQGPDIFYHNQRRKPSALLYGSLIHRRGYGALCAAMYRHSIESPSEGITTARGGWQFAYTLGFASHAVLDRHTHPFINYWSGWRDPHDSETEHLRGMHPFLERLVDRAVLLRYRNQEPLAFGFFDQITCGPEPPEHLVSMLAAALRATYPRAVDDAELEQRIRCAYLDSMGFYEWTDAVDVPFLQRGLKREAAGEASRRWLSIVHPPFVPRDLDVMNDAHRLWTHPCSSREEREESFWDLMATALSEMEQIASQIAELWIPAGLPDQIDERARRIEGLVGNANLSDGRDTERPCRKKHSDPLPLHELQQEIRQIIADGLVD